MRTFAVLAFAGSAAAFMATPLAAGASKIHMSNVEGTRREMVVKAAGVVAGAAGLAATQEAQATAGDFGKFSFFGPAASSTPFNALTDPMNGNTKAPEDILFSYGNDKEIARCKAGIKESAKRIDTIGPMVSSKKWTDARTEMRLQMGVMKKYMVAVNTKTGDKAAAAAYKKFSLAMDDLDYACRIKDPATAGPAYDKVVETLKGYTSLM